MKRKLRDRLSKAEEIIKTDFVSYGYELYLPKLVNLLQGKITKFWKSTVIELIVIVFSEINETDHNWSILVTVYTLLRPPIIIRREAALR